jgi:hypothetical protein
MLIVKIFDLLMAIVTVTGLAPGSNYYDFSIGEANW